MSENTFTAWITKWATTRGILEIQARMSRTSDDTIFKVNLSPHYNGHYYGEGREWHRTREAAVAQAYKMRDAKISSLRRQIAKLEKMEF